MTFDELKTWLLESDEVGDSRTVSITRTYCPESGKPEWEVSLVTLGQGAYRYNGDNMEEGFDYVVDSLQAKLEERIEAAQRALDGLKRL